MQKEKLDMLKKFIEAKISPLLVVDLPIDIFDNAVILKSDIKRELLNGHYEQDEFCPPMWYDELVNKSKEGYALLIIENINSIDAKEQTKFIEILKYKKVSTFELPDNVIVIATATDLGVKKIADDVYSLMAQI